MANGIMRDGVIGRPDCRSVLADTGAKVMSKMRQLWSGTVITERANFNRLMAFLADYIGTPCLWVAAPGRGDLVAAIAFGRFVRAVPVIANSQMITASLEIAGNR